MSGNSSQNILNKELEMTAKLFGKIMSERKIIDGVVTDIGLKCIVEGLKREGKMFLFAITALEECKNSIEHENGLKNILKCQQLKEKKPDLYEHMCKRYYQLHSPQDHQNIAKTEVQQPKAAHTPNISRPDPGMKRENIPSVTTPDQRPSEGGLNQNIARLKKPIPQNPLSNTPTHPGKYFTPDQNSIPGWPPQQQQLMGAGRVLYPPNTAPQNNSARPNIPDNFSLGLAADTPNNKRTLNKVSKEFIPKTQQVQGYLEKDEMKLPTEFQEDLNTILNMTGTDQIYHKAIELEKKIKEEYIENMAHHIVVKRVIDADEKRIEFYSNFFNAMKRKSIVNSLINECIQAILTIITTEFARSSHRNEMGSTVSTPIKNVSYFLGYLTIFHNRPLLTNELDLKQLLLESYEKK